MFAKYWKRLLKTNPALGDVENRMTISVGSFQRQLKKAYEQGQRDLKACMEAAGEFGDFKQKSEGSFDRMFDGIFGSD